MSDACIVWLQVPVGGEEAATVLRTVGVQRNFDFAQQDHVALGAALDLLDFETGAAVAGTKFVYLRRAAALLELGLCNWAMQACCALGWVLAVSLCKCQC